MTGEQQIRCRNCDTVLTYSHLIENEHGEQACPNCSEEHNFEHVSGELDVQQNNTNPTCARCGTAIETFIELEEEDPDEVLTPGETTKHTTLEPGRVVVEHQGDEVNVYHSKGRTARSSTPHARVGRAHFCSFQCLLGWSLDEWQSRVVEWSIDNFGSQSYNKPYKGVDEEWGEFAHALLKIEQGIRPDDEDVGYMPMLDSVGDMFVYMADLGGRLEQLREDLLERYSEARNEGDDDRAEKIWKFLDDMPNDTSISLGQAVEYAWFDEVRDREWDSILKEDDNE